jgi:hypothetical protein
MTTCPPACCPPWCVSPHADGRGEDDWLHVGEPVVLTTGVSALPCMSVDPDTGVVDGPYVLIGETEYTLEETAQLGAALISLARTGGVTRPGAAGRRSPGP